MIDCHAHYDSERYDSDRDAILKAINANGVKAIINAGCDIPSSQASVDLAHKYGFMYACVGFQPEFAADATGDWLSRIEAMLADKKVVAIGEIGLDYSHDNYPSKQKQAEVFEAQLDLARRTGKKVVIHDRDAHFDTLAAVKKYPEVKGVFHCYAGSVEMAKELQSIGYMISVGGVLTFKNARVLPDVIKALPLEMILTETDAPYLSPVPHRGERNRSDYISYVLQKIAEIKGVEIETVKAVTEANAVRFYGLPQNV